MCQNIQLKERHGQITIQGKPLTLLGSEIKIDKSAPDATLLDGDLHPVNLSSLIDKWEILIVSTVPSLDTAVCDLQTKKFNETAINLTPKAHIVTVSMDLPFAQKRWCGANEISRLTLLSDHKDASLGSAYGILIKELRLLARSVFVIHKGIVKYVQLVKEVTDTPDYESVLREVKKL